MKKTLLIYLLGLLAWSASLSAQNVLPAFPGAEGFGRYTTGGRGGKVYVVNTLEDNNEGDATTRKGSFRWCINQSGARTILFEVSGTIYLKSALSVRNGNLTIAGQSAPGDGICVADYPFTVSANNVIVRFMRFRLGNRQVAYHEGDGFGAMDIKNFIMDHCSVSWSIDECLSVLGSVNTTVQWCVVSQSLREAGHSKGAHGYGGNWGGSGASFHHNLICHCESRTPRLGPRQTTQTDERMDMRNNVIYNWGGSGCYGGEGMNVNIVNNYYKPGPGTKMKPDYIQYRISAIGIRTTDYCTNANGSWNGWAPMHHVWGKFFVDGNYMEGFPDVTADNWTKGIYAQINNASVDHLFTPTTRDTMRLDQPISFSYTTTHTAQQAYEKVLAYAGASLVRDSHDSLMMADVRQSKASYTGSGNIKGIINSQEDLRPVDADDAWSPWPVLKQTQAHLDSDGDGIPDEKEREMGLNPHDALDGNQLNEDGYTMLEVYLNDLVAHLTEQQYQGGEVQGELPDMTVYDPIRTDVTLTWKLGGSQCAGSATVIPADKIASSQASFTGFSLSQSNYFGVSFTKFQPSQSQSSANAACSIRFALSPKNGECFTPSSVSFKAVRCGTDGGLMDVFWQTADGELVEIETALKPDRNSNAYSDYAFDLSRRNLPATKGEGAFLFYVYSLGTNKQIGLADLCFGGAIDAVDGLQRPSSMVDDVYFYDLQGRRVLHPEKGLYVRQGKKYLFN